MLAVFSEISALNAGGMKFGTTVTRRLLTALGSPDKCLKIIHIAGTNGKGAVAKYVTQILLAAGRRTGTFTSPAVTGYFDQFRVDGQPIPDTVLAKYFTVALEKADGATGFEVETAGALLAFEQLGCEYAVVECGLGGLNDATNAVSRKEVAVITSIGLEHTAVLGDTIEKICYQKAGIIKNCPAVVCALQPPEALEYFKSLGATIAGGVNILSADNGGVRFWYGGREYFTKMPVGGYAYDAAAAIEAAKLLGIAEDKIAVGVARAVTPGRVQIIRRGGNEYIVDGGHNPSAVKFLAELLGRYPPESVTLIFGCLSDKDVEGVLSSLGGLASRAIAVRPDSPRAMDLGKIEHALRRHFGQVEAEKGLCAALEKSSGVVAVSGTFTMVQEALNWIEKRQ